MLVDWSDLFRPICVRPARCGCWRSADRTTRAIRLRSPAVRHCKIKGDLSEQDDTNCDEEGGEPTAFVDVFVKKVFSGNGIADVGECADRGAGQRELRDAQRKQHGKEVQGHAEGADHKRDVAKDGAYGAG